MNPTINDGRSLRCITFCDTPGLLVELLDTFEVERLKEYDDLQIYTCPRKTVHRADSCFPIVGDDINKKKINRLDPLKNYWLNWDGETRFPTIVFISNDRKSHEWFRN